MGLNSGFHIVLMRLIGKGYYNIMSSANRAASHHMSAIVVPISCYEDAGCRSSPNLKGHTGVKYSM